jgi:hypothetical protein
MPNARTAHMSGKLCVLASSNVETTESAESRMTRNFQFHIVHEMRKLPRRGLLNLSLTERRVDWRRSASMGSDA